jgi:hypothetical protein
MRIRLSLNVLPFVDMKSEWKQLATDHTLIQLSAIDIHDRATNHCVLHDQAFIMRLYGWEDDKAVVLTAEAANMSTGMYQHQEHPAGDRYSICTGGQSPSLESSRDELQRHYTGVHRGKIGEIIPPPSCAQKGFVCCRLDLTLASNSKAHLLSRTSSS